MDGIELVRIRTHLPPRVDLQNNIKLIDLKREGKKEGGIEIEKERQRDGRGGKEREGEGEREEIGT